MVDRDTLGVLYDAVFADPASDEARRVLADALIERSHPHGEFIALQLTGDRKHAKRLTALKTKSEARFIGDLGKVLAPRGRAYRRGFLSKAKLVFDTPDQRLRTRRSRWLRTIEHLLTDDEAIASDPRMKMLRTVGMQGIDGLLAMSNAEEILPVEQVWPVRVEGQPNWAQLGGSLPGVTHLAVVGDGGWNRVTALDELLETPFGQQLESIYIGGAGQSLRASGERYFAQSARLKRLRGGGAYLERSGDDVVLVRPTDAVPSDVFMDSIWALAERTQRRFSIVVEVSGRLKKPDWEVFLDDAPVPTSVRKAPKGLLAQSAADSFSVKSEDRRDRRVGYVRGLNEPVYEDGWE